MEIQDLKEVEAIESISSLTPWSKQMFLGEMAHPHSFCFVMASERVTGYLCFRDVGEESELLNICIHPNYRHRGLGHELMQFYTNFSIERGIKNFYLEVHDANQSAQRLYQTFSYRAIGVRRRYYRGEADAIRMAKEVGRNA